MSCDREEWFESGCALKTTLYTADIISDQPFKQWLESTLRKTWLLNTQYGFSTQTCALCSLYLMQFVHISNYQFYLPTCLNIEANSSTAVQLTRLACIMLAAKYNESKFPNYKNVQQVFKLNIRALKQMEVYVCQVLGFSFKQLTAVELVEEAIEIFSNANGILVNAAKGHLHAIYTSLAPLSTAPQPLALSVLQALNCSELKKPISILQRYHPVQGYDS